MLPRYPVALRKGFIYVCVFVLVSQSCSTLCRTIDCSPPDSSVHGILQAKILEWVAISSSRGSSQPRYQTFLSLYIYIYIAAANLPQSCLTLCNPIDSSPHGSSVHGIL